MFPKYLNVTELNLRRLTEGASTVSITLQLKISIKQLGI